MNAIKNGYRPEPAEPRRFDKIERVTGADGRSHLVLQANIEGRLRKFELTADEVQEFGLLGLEVVDEIRRIRIAVEAMEAALAPPAQQQNQ